MWLRILSLMFLVCGLCVAAQAQSRWQRCLPQDLEADVVISTEPATRTRAARPITVKDKLRQLGARCRGRRLVDKKGKQIRFHRLVGCWGNPPANYLEIMEDQRQELARLRRRYRVVEISCNPSGVMVQ